jgi:hypothetical protein
MDLSFPITWAKFLEEYIFYFIISVGKTETELSLLAEKLKSLSVSVKDDKLKVRTDKNR